MNIKLYSTHCAHCQGIAMMLKSKKLSYEEIRKLIEQGSFEKEGIKIEKEQVNIEKKFLPKYEKDKVMVCLSNSDCIVLCFPSCSFFVISYSFLNIFNFSSKSCKFF